MVPFHTGRMADGPCVTVAVLLALIGAPGTRSLGADGARVLAVGAVPGKSHWNFMSAVCRALTDNGHRVTVFTSFPDGDRANYTEVDVSGDLPRALDNGVETMVGKFGDKWTAVRAAHDVSRRYCDKIHANAAFRDVLRRRSDFDVILVEPLWTDCMSYAAAALDVPLVYVIPSPMITVLERVHFGDVPNPAFVSHLLARHAVPRTFFQRFANAALLAYDSAALRVHQVRLGLFDPNVYYRSPTVRPSALFVNTHYITEAPRPFLPNIVHVGGIHLNPPKSIPPDVLKFIEDSPNGVILLTFGSSIKMSTLPVHVQKAFVEALAQVPQNILWKFEGEMENQPKNVMTMKWFPQRDILMHPNVKLFISHGGISGVYEAVDAGVPVLGFPLYYDQFRNIENLVDAGMAISMDLFTVRRDALLKNVLDLIDNEKFTKNAKIASERFSDRPMSPAQSVVYWTEYVIRHKGAPHLKSHSLDLTWYQYFLLDVIAVALILTYLILYIVKNILKMIYKCFSKLFKYNKAKSE